MLVGGDAKVSIDEVRATVGMTYDDLNTFLAGKPGKIRVKPADDEREIEISGTADVPFLGSQEIDGVTAFDVRDNRITLVPPRLVLHATANASIPIPLGWLHLPSIPIPVGGLPFDLNVVSASTNASGYRSRPPRSTSCHPRGSSPATIRAASRAPRRLPDGKPRARGDGAGHQPADGAPPGTKATSLPSTARRP
jgi:hypothetical protein